MSLSTFHFLKNVASYLRVEGEDPPDVQLQEDGYLFLASEEGEGVMRENHALQRNLGAAVALKSPQGLQRQFPWLNVEGIKLGSLGIIIAIINASSTLLVNSAVGSPFFLEEGKCTPW